MIKRIGGAVLDWVSDPEYERMEMLFALFLVGLPIMVCYGVFYLGKCFGWPPN